MRLRYHSCASTSSLTLIVPRPTFYTCHPRFVQIRQIVRNPFRKCKDRQRIQYRERWQCAATLFRSVILCVTCHLKCMKTAPHRAGRIFLCSVSPNQRLQRRRKCSKALDLLSTPAEPQYSFRKRRPNCHCKTSAPAFPGASYGWLMQCSMARHTYARAAGIVFPYAPSQTLFSSLQTRCRHRFGLR